MQIRFRNRAGRFVFLVLLLSLSAACGDDSTPSPDASDVHDAGISPHCNGITCSGNGQCVATDGAAQCMCDEGYRAVGLDCVEGDCVPSPHAREACDVGDVYWYDSCGMREEQSASCAGNGCVDGACSAENDAAPVLSNFRVTSDQPDRLYFDSSKWIVATSVDGFTLSGLTLTGVSVAPGQNSGHFFSVDAPFTFWDNNTIRYDGGSDISDPRGNTVHPFTLTYIENQIEEPEAEVDRYVTSSASGSGDGTSEASAWTLAQGFTGAEGGQTVWIKAGDYGAVNIEVAVRSTDPTRPVKFIGYRNVTGDITTHMVDTFDYVSPSAAAATIDPAAFPVLSGDGVWNGTGLYFRSQSNIVMKHLQIRGYHHNIWITGEASNYYLENVNSSLARAYGSDDQATGEGLLVGNVTTVSNVRLNKCLAIDDSGVGFRTFGSHNAVINSEVWSGETRTVNESTDYYFSWYKSIDSIFYNNQAIRVGDIQHKGHGYTLKQSGSYNLISHNELSNISEGIAFARENSHHNVAKHNVIRGGEWPEGEGLISTALVARSGSHDNIFEFNVGYDLEQCIANWQGNETVQEGSLASRNNIFRNNLFVRFKTAIVSSNQARVLNRDFDIDGVRIYNNTFAMGLDALFVDSSTGEMDLNFTNCEFKNNLVHSMDSRFRFYRTYASETQYTQEYNNYFNAAASTSLPSGTGNVSIDPQFVELVDFVPNATLNAISLPGVDYDYDGTPRDLAAPTIGAQER